MRLLTEYELNLVAGGRGSSDIVVTAPTWVDWSWTFSDDGGPRGGGSSGGSEPDPEPEPDCHNTNDVTGVMAPDGARYLVPEKVDSKYLNKTYAHVAEVASKEGKIAAAYEIARMYTDPANEFFVDFKRAGSDTAPSSWEDAGNVTYYSTSLGKEVTADAFEAFGNFWFGFLMTGAGFLYEETKAIAALTQGDGYQKLSSSNPVSWVEAAAQASSDGDDPQDRPFVTDGIDKAQKYMANPHANGNMIGVKTEACK